MKETTIVKQQDVFITTQIEGSCWREQDDQADKFHCVHLFF